jgi:hypothetical protein
MHMHIMNNGEFTEAVHRNSTQSPPEHNHHTGFWKYKLKEMSV